MIFSHGTPPSLGNPFPSRPPLSSLSWRTSFHSYLPLALMFLLSWPSSPGEPSLGHLLHWTTSTGPSPVLALLPPTRSHLPWTISSPGQLSPHSFSFPEPPLPWTSGPPPIALLPWATSPFGQPSLSWLSLFHEPCSLDHLLLWATSRGPFPGHLTCHPPCVPRAHPPRGSSRSPTCSLGERVIISALRLFKTPESKFYYRVGEEGSLTTYCSKRNTFNSIYSGMTLKSSGEGTERPGDGAPIKRCR